MAMQVELLLSCGDIIAIPLESILEIPATGTEIKCALHRKTVTVKRVGKPYRVQNGEEIIHHDKQEQPRLEGLDNG